jgi:hypothetical protein
LRNYLLGVQKDRRLRLGVHRNYSLEITRLKLPLGFTEIPWGSHKSLGVHRNYSLEITLGVEKLHAWG